MTHKKSHRVDIISSFKRLNGRFGGVLTALFLLIGLPYLFIEWKYPTHVFRYKLTVDVMTPDGIKSGSSIIESKLINHIRIGDMGGLGWYVTGEAVFIDLGHGKNFVVTLTDHGSTQRDSQNAAVLPYWPEIRKQTIPQILAEYGSNKIRNIPISYLPTSVTFTDVNDPLSVRIVDPKKLHLTFGDGYSITRVSIQSTQERYSTSIKQKLPAITNWSWKQMGPQGTSESIKRSQLWHAIADHFVHRGDVL